MRRGRRKSLSFRFHEILRQAQDDNVFGLRPKWKLIQGVLINGMCNFKDGTRAATAASKSNAELDEKSTSDCAVLLATAWRTKRSGIMSVRHLFMRVLSVVPRYAVTVGSLARGNGDRENT